MAAVKSWEETSVAAAVGTAVVVEHLSDSSCCGEAAAAAGQLLQLPHAVQPWQPSFVVEAAACSKPSRTRVKKVFVAGLTAAAAAAGLQT